MAFATKLLFEFPPKFLNQKERERVLLPYTFSLYIFRDYITIHNSQSGSEKLHQNMFYLLRLSVTSKRVIRFLSISFREKERKKERMGNCFSDVEGGKQAVGGTQQRPNSIAATNNNNGGHNDAIEFFFRSRGIQPLFTQIEVMYVKYKVPKKKKKVRNFFNISLCFYMYN